VSPIRYVLSIIHFTVCMPIVIGLGQGHYVFTNDRKGVHFVKIDLLGDKTVGHLTQYLLFWIDHVRDRPCCLSLWRGIILSHWDVGFHLCSFFIFFQLLRHYSELWFKCYDHFGFCSWCFLSFLCWLDCFFLVTFINYCSLSCVRAGVNLSVDTCMVAKGFIVFHKLTTSLFV